MKRFSIIVGFVILVPLYAADPPGFVHWRSATLKGFEQKLAPKINAQKAAVEQIGNFGNHVVLAVHRQGNGEVEIHETQVDVFVVQSGEAALIVGGKVEGGKPTGPGEIRGTSIQGGERVSLSAGDMVHIPAKLPHQVMVDPGKQITYLVVKVPAQ